MTKTLGEEALKVHRMMERLHDVFLASGARKDTISFRLDSDGLELLVTKDLFEMLVDLSTPECGCVINHIDNCSILRYTLHNHTVSVVLFPPDMPAWLYDEWEYYTKREDQEDG